MNFFHCVGGSQALRIVVSHGFVVALYLYISAFRLVPAAMAAKTRQGKLVWWSIAIVFPFCAVAGYATTILAGWFPALAYPLKEWMSHLDVVATLVFIGVTSTQQLKSVGNDSIKSDIEKALEGSNPSDVLAEIKRLI